MKKYVPRFSLRFAAATLCAAVLPATLAACSGGGGGGALEFSSSSSSGGSSSGGSSSGGSSSGGSSTGGSSGGLSVPCVTSGTRWSDITTGNSSTAWPPPVVPTPTSGITTAMTGSHATYNVGPGQTYADLTSVPWLSLVAGDVVNIYYQATPYLTKFALRSQGTAAAPIIINGVTDASCNRPVISGNGAVTAADAISSGFFTTTGGALIEDQAVIVMYSGASDTYGWTPSYITIQNLEITGANGGSSYTFTNHAGVLTPWATSGANGVYAVMVSNLTIQNCVITGNDEGVFVNSQDPPRTSYYVTLRGNYIWGNGLPRNYLNHNIYVQGVRTLYEGNYIGEVIPTSQGSSLKDRSSGTVVRYNYIDSSLRAIDLVDTQLDTTVASDPLYNYAWVYGNLIVDDFSSPVSSTDLIHWGGDSDFAGEVYRNGTLYFYFNTVLVENDPNFENIGIFDMPAAFGTSPPSGPQSVEARSNIFWFTGNSANTTVELGICCGTITLADTNWISVGFVASNETGNTVTLNTPGGYLSGTIPGLNANLTLSASSGAPVLGRGVLAPTSVPSATPYPTSLSSLAVYQQTTTNQANLQPSAEYANLTAIVTRPNTNDLGAYAAQ